MALAKEGTHQNSRCPFPSGFDPTLDFLGFKGHHGSMMMEEENCSETLPMNNFIEYNVNSLPQVVQSNNIALGHWAYSSSYSSVLSFEQVGRNIASSSSYSKIDQEGECGIWMDGMDEEFQVSDRLARDASNCYGPVERQYEERFDLVYSSVASSIQSFNEIREIERSSLKRPFMEGDMQLPSKKQCGNNKKATKAKSSVSKDPQSTAAKNRRERISERLKVLQGLVPNGTKVDLVTMLEKAISYVNFLQLQVKVLATDQFWPAQGGKAPEISLVRIMARFWYLVSAVFESFRASVDWVGGSGDCPEEVFED